jgi:tRNA-specific 2-thiouridylase
MSDRPTVAVAMSGGVDSSVAALLLREKYYVVGLTMHLTGEREPESVAAARRAAAHLDIPLQVIDLREVFQSAVVDPMVAEYSRGRTPNPCLECNRFVKWGELLDRALAIGADFLATGHYAHVRQEGGEFALLRASDRAKDQSYMLSVLGQKQLAHAIFPLGEMSKKEVRALACEKKLPAATLPESQELCFLANGNYRDFLARRVPQALLGGPILNRRGELLGRHSGLASFTIGQRKGIGVPSPRAMYVLELDPVRNAVIVGEVVELGHRELLAEEAHWVRDLAPASPFFAEVKIRSTAAEQPAEVILEQGGQVRVRFAKLLRDITPGQAAVFYQGERCLGMATIREALA